MATLGKSGDAIKLEVVTGIDATLLNEIVHGLRHEL